MPLRAGRVVPTNRVANRAGVGKQAIYRRWPSKAPLVAEAIMDTYRRSGGSDLPDTGDIAADLRGWLHGQAKALAAPENSALLRALAAAAADDPHDGKALYRQLTVPQHDAVDCRDRTRMGATSSRCVAIRGAGEFTVYESVTSDPTSFAPNPNRWRFRRNSSTARRAGGW